MHPDFWRDRWFRGQIGFHQPAVERYLEEHWADIEIAKDSYVFVPLCGKSLDLLWLRDTGHNVIGVELSEIATQAFCVENGVPARRRPTPTFDRYEASRLTLLRGDYFNLTPALLSEVRAVYDRAALISWTPDLRASYVEHMTAITRPGTPTLLITLEYSQAQMNGPPFSVELGELEDLYSADYDIQELGRRDILATEPRMRAKGVSKLLEVCYRLVRKE
jgi:thiopurine S-methyltransferase